MWVRYVKCGFFKKGHRTPGDLSHALASGACIERAGSLILSIFIVIEYWGLCIWGVGCVVVCRGVFQNVSGLTVKGLADCFQC